MTSRRSFPAATPSALSTSTRTEAGRDRHQSARARNWPGYENPTWAAPRDGRRPRRHRELRRRRSSTATGFPKSPSRTRFAMSPASSEGLVWLARHDGDPRQRWKAPQQIDKFPTSHHIAWMDADGDGKKELINAPLLGPKGAAPTLRPGQGAAVLLPPDRLEAPDDHRQRHQRHHPPRAGRSPGTATSGINCS